MKSTIYIMVADPEEAERDDRLMTDFIRELKKLSDPDTVAIPNSKFLLLVSKWDLISKNLGGKVKADYAAYKNNFRNFFEKKMPDSYLHAANTPFAVSHFSIGRVKQHKEDQIIEQRNSARSEIVAKWIYKTVTGKSLVREPSKIKKLFESFFGQ